MADHKDADIVLKLYDLRREAVMRDSRDKMTMQFNPTSFEEFMAVAMDFENPMNVAFRQVSSYWEMAFGMAEAGIVDPEYLVENCGEGMVLYVKCMPFIEQFREQFSPTSFQHAQWAAENTEIGKSYVEMMKKWMEEMAQQA
jgi:hypothetical protein